MSAVEFRDVDVLFGADRARALALVDEGRTRDEILRETDVVLGAAGVSFRVEPGEICVLMGLSGSGKSTVLRVVNRLNEAARGQVLVRHRGAPVDVARCDERTLRDLRTHTVSMVFQQFGLLPWRTVRENAGLGLELQGMRATERRRIVDEKLAMVGLAQWAEKYVHELSGGMQQRVGLARAFATDADILLMDEPFSALDPLIRTKLQDELLELQRSIRKTILFVSHDLDEAMKLGNRIVIMEAGRIVQIGTPQDILLQPATPYVAEFVRHVNPLGVLRARALMCPAAALPGARPRVVLDEDGLVHLTLDENGRPVAVEVANGVGRLVPAGPGHPAPSAPGEVALAADDLFLRDVIALKGTNRHPVVLVDGDGRFAGLCGDREIYGGLLQRGPALPSRA